MSKKIGEIYDLGHGMISLQMTGEVTEAQQERIMNILRVSSSALSLSESEILGTLERAMSGLQMAKLAGGLTPELARNYAVTITELEKVIAYYKVYVVDSV